MSYDIIHLDDPSGWAALELLLSREQNSSRITATVIGQLRQLQAVAALVEESYIDRDFSEAYFSYYAKTFRRHTKLCTRILFFASDIAFLNSTDGVKATSEKLQQAAFLGQVILRPISRAPVGQAILQIPPLPNSYDGGLLIGADYKAHVLGAELTVRAAPMTQQDSRIGACAQATIWVAARHFHARHRGPWLSTVSITQAAIATSEFQINSVLPAGSEFLTLNSMTASLRAAGREPLVFVCSNIGNPMPLPIWNALRPADVIARYLDSGIPVIVGLCFPGQGIGHAVIATGQLQKNTLPIILPSKPTIAASIEAFYVNDDQIGPNVRVAIDNTIAIGEAHYNISGNVMYLIVPLPQKVYLPAETAEEIAWGALARYTADWNAFKISHGASLGISTSLGDDLVNGLGTQKVLARTYLTYGWKYKQRGIRNKFSNEVRQIIRELEVPRFVYVTEFFLDRDFVGKARYQQKIIAHIVVDATAKHQDMDSILLMHAPGFCSWHAHDPSGAFLQFVAAIPDSTTYYPKARGEADFEKFEAADALTH